MPPISLLRPLPIDLIYFLLPLVIGLAVFCIGRFLNRWTMMVRAGLVGLTLGAICVTFALLFRAIPRPIDLAFSYAGGVVVVLCWMILGVIGCSWSAPNPSSDFLFRIGLVVFPLALIGVESGGSLWFRYYRPEVWHNRPNPAGSMAQTTTTTCLPASAAMLLHQYGFPNASEGECAYLANTSFFGTDSHIMARAITQKIGKRGVRAIAVTATYQDMIDLGKPFIAQMQMESVGNHAVLVRRLSQHMVEVIDPLDGNPRDDWKPKRFQEMWTGHAIVITGMEPPEIH